MLEPIMANNARPSLLIRYVFIALEALGNQIGKWRR
jgi:hypothetical protein